MNIIFKWRREIESDEIAKFLRLVADKIEAGMISGTLLDKDGIVGEWRLA